MNSKVKLKYLIQFAIYCLALLMGNAIFINRNREITLFSVFLSLVLAFIMTLVVYVLNNKKE